MAKFKRNNLQLKTNQKIELGDSQESIIKYDGSDLLLNPSSGGVQLYYDGSKQLETGSTGVHLSVSMTMQDAASANGAMRIRTPGNAVYWENTFAGDTYIQVGGQTLFHATYNNAVNLYWGGSGVKIATTSGGAAVTGDLAVTGNITMESGKDVATQEYVQQQVGLGIETGNTFMSTGDTTSNIDFIQTQGSSNYSIGYSIINEVDNPPLLFGSGIIEKRLDGFRVMLSSPVDTDNYYISWVVGDALLGSSSSSSRSSSSSSRSSSSSESSSSTSTSSSSNSEATHMSGWPFLPDTIQVVMGNAWQTDSGFEEDDVVILKRYPIVSGNWVYYSEDGTLAYSPTNRLKWGNYPSAMNMAVLNTASTKWTQAISIGNDITNTTARGSVYTFKELYNKSWILNNGYNAQLITAATWNNVFKSMTIIDN
jgi:hypothetical protein